MRYLTLLLLVSTVAVAEPCDPTPDPGVDPIRILQADQADIGNVDGHRVYYREPYVNWTWRLLADLPCTDYLWDPDDPGSAQHLCPLVEGYVPPVRYIDPVPTGTSVQYSATAYNEHGESAKSATAYDQHGGGDTFCWPMVTEW